MKLGLLIVIGSSLAAIGAEPQPKPGDLPCDDVFPGGQLMMMLVDPPVWYIDETL